jgi:RND family efflux transporter MFP subunit
MKKKSIIIVAIIVVPVTLMAWTLASNKKEIESRKEVKTAESAISVTVASAEIKELSEDLVLTGTTQPIKEVNIASESTGKIIQVNFGMGDYITEGTVLARIDDTYKRIAYENAKLNYSKCKDDLSRYEALREGDAVSVTQLRDIQLSYDNAGLQLENAKKQLDDTRIIAPFSGYITSQNTERGAFVNAGSVIAGIADISKLKVLLDVSETNAYELHEGQPVRVTSDVHPEIIYKGTILNVSPKAGASHTYPVEITIPNNNQYRLKAGTYVNVTVNINNKGKALMIPREAIVSSVKDPAVYLLQGDIVHLVKIGTGRNFDADLEVVSGLSEGDQVVISGQLNLADGSKISVIQ